jgi:capsular polysaccharide export protein
MPGLTFQGGLDSFWRYAKQPDQRLFRWFRNTVIHGTQINGGLYSRQSIDMAVSNALPRILSDKGALEKML